MPELAVTLFGPLRVALDGQALSWLYSDKVRALLAYLVLEANRPHRRESLAGLLWPGYPEPSARQSLSQTLFALRGVIDPGGATGLADALITASRTDVLLNGAAVSSDAGSFDALLNACLAHGHPTGHGCGTCTGRLAEALSLFQGEVLAGFSLPDSPEFNEWLAVQRERWRRRAVGVAAGLAQAGEAAGGGEQAVEHARRWTELDPLDEEAHRCLMRLLAGAGRRTAALEHFERCRLLLHGQLGIGPEPATLELVERIKAGEGVSAPPADAVSHRPAPTPPPPAAVPHYRPADAAGDRRDRTPRHNLPASVDSFIGRERALAEVRGLLLDPAVRLVTLVGAGGMGKTRLALEVARFCLADFAGGAWLVDLAPLPADEQRPDVGPAPGDHCESATELVVNAVAGVLAVHGGGGVQALVTALQERRLLLLLDNCEHVLSGVAPLIGDLLERCPSLTVLATSREPLRVAGEHLYEVSPLEVPESVLGPGRSGTALACSAVRLLAERAAAARYGTGIDETNIAAAASLVRHLDGMPLAIELAAARLSAVTLADLAMWLAGTPEREPDGQRWVALGSGSRAAHPRQRTLLNTVAWSYALLDESERVLFDRLSVFSGSFGIDAATAVCGTGGLNAVQVPLRLAVLVDCSLVQRLAATDGEPRYRLLETLRAYARERLAERGESGSVAARHAAYYANLIDNVAPVLRHGEPHCLGTLDDVERDMDNVAAAVRWSLSEGDGMEALRIAGSAPFWGVRHVQLAELRDWALAALERTERHLGHPADARLRAWALYTVANHDFIWYDLEEMAGTNEAQVAAALEAEDGPALAWARYNQARLANHQGRSPDEERHLRESLALANESGEVGLAAHLQVFLAGFAPREERAALLERVLAHTPEGYQAYAYQVAANVMWMAGDTTHAERWSRRSVDRWLEMGSLRSAGSTRRILAGVLAQVGRLAEAAEQYELGARECRQAGDENGRMLGLVQGCVLAWRALDPGAGATLHRLLDEPYGLGPGRYGVINRHWLLRVAYGLGERELVRRLEAESLAIDNLSEYAYGRHALEDGRGWDAFLTGDYVAAVGYFREAFQAVRSSNRDDAAESMEHLGWALAAAGQLDEAAAILAEAQSEREAMGIVLYPVEVPHHERAVAAVGRPVSGESVQ